MTRSFLLAVVSLAVAVAACTPGSSTDVGNDATTTYTLSALEESTRELESLLEQQRALDDWVESPEYRAARRDWMAHIQVKMREYVISSYLAGEIPGGSCEIGETGIGIDCGAYDYYTDELIEAQRFGLCTWYLAEIGCENSGGRFTANWRLIYEDRVGLSG